MSVSNSGSNNSYDDEAIAQLANRVDELEAAVSDRDDRIDELEQRVDDQDNVIDDQGETIQRLRQQLSEHRDHVGQQTAELNQRVSAVEDEVDDMADDDDREGGSSDSEPEGSDGQSTPLETVCTLDESTAVRELTSNQRRARAIAKDFTDYARKCPNGLVIKSSEVRRVLTAMEENTTIYRKTASRVMEFISRLGGEGARVVETRSGEKAICIDEELADRVSTVDTVEPEGAVTQAVV
jgi:uncharacterized coiled-coil protein SlyX